MFPPSGISLRRLWDLYEKKNKCFLWLSDRNTSLMAKKFCKWNRVLCSVRGSWPGLRPQNKELFKNIMLHMGKWKATHTLCYIFGKCEQVFFNVIVFYLFVYLFLVSNRQWAYFTTQKVLQKFYVCVTKSSEPVAVMCFSVANKSFSLDKHSTYEVMLLVTPSPTSKNEKEEKEGLWGGTEARVKRGWGRAGKKRKKR